jgi:hypothetical protein
MFNEGDTVLHVFHREYGEGVIERKITRRSSFVRWGDRGSTVEMHKNLEPVNKEESNE